VSKERGPTASGSVVAAAALAALGAFMYRDWIAETGFTSRKYDQARQLFKQAVQEVVYLGRQRCLTSARCRACTPSVLGSAIHAPVQKRQRRRLGRRKLTEPPCPLSFDT